MNVRDQQRYRRRRQQQNSPSMASTSPSMDQEEHQYDKQYPQQQQQYDKQQQQQQQKEQSRRNDTLEVPVLEQLGGEGGARSRLRQQEEQQLQERQQQRQQQQQERQQQQQQQRSVEQERIHQEHERVHQEQERMHQEHERSRHEYQQQRVSQQEQQRASHDKERSQKHERIYQNQQQRPQQRVSQEPQAQRPQQQQNVQSLQFPRERASDPPAKKGGARSTSDPSATKGTLISGSGDSSYYASYLSMPVPSSASGMVSVLELLSIDEDDSCNNLDAIGNKNNSNGNGNEFDEKAKAESKQHAADVAAIVQSMMAATADGEHDIGELRGKVDDQLRTMMESNQNDVQQWNTQLQQMQQSRERQHGQTTSLAQQQPWRRQEQRLPVAAAPKRKDLVSSYNTTSSVSYLQQPQQRQLPAQQGRDQSRRPSKQPPRPQPTQRMPPSLSARANELVTSRSVALVDAASSTDQSNSTPWCLDMESATQDLLRMSGQRKVSSEQRQDQQQRQSQRQQPVTIDALEPSISRDVTVAANNLSGNREEHQDYEDVVSGSGSRASHYAKMVGRSSDVNDRDGLPVESSPSRFSRLGSNQSRLPQEDPILSARRSKMASKEPQGMVLERDERVMLQDRDKHDYRISDDRFHSDQPATTAVVLTSRQQHQSDSPLLTRGSERDEQEYRVRDDRFHPDRPATPASIAAVVTTPRQQRTSKEKSDSPPLTRASERDERDYRVRDNRFHPDQPATPASTAAVVTTPRQQRPSKEQQSDSPPLTRVSSDLSLREEAIRQDREDREERFQLEEQMKIQEQEKEQLQWSREKQKQRYEELFYQQEQLQPQHQEQSQQKQYEESVQQKPQLQGHQQKEPWEQQEQSESSQGSRRFFPTDEATDIPKQEEADDEYEGATAEEAAFTRKIAEQQEDNDKKSQEASNFRYREECLEIIQIPTSPRQSDIIQVPTSPSESVEVSTWNDELTEEDTSLVSLPPIPNVERSLLQVQESEYEESSSDSVPADYYYDNSDKVAPLPTESDAPSTDKPLMDRQQPEKDDAPFVSKDARTDVPAELRLPRPSDSETERSRVPKHVGSLDSSETFEVISTVDKTKRNELPNGKNSSVASKQVAAVPTQRTEATTNEAPTDWKDKPRRSSAHGARIEDHKEPSSSEVENRRYVSPVHFMRETAVAPSTPEQKKEEHAHDPVYSPRSPDIKEDVLAHPQVGEDIIKISHVRLKALEDPYGDKGQYTGMLVRRKPHGQGTMQYEDGRCYTGDFKFGRWHGSGRALFSNGDLYVGEYDMDQRHGKGRYEWEDGRMYDGNFHRDQRQGMGTYSWADGALYTGDFFAGQRHGHGTYKFVDGSVYIGEWRSGKYHGVGECEWADGRYYRGEWENGRAHGYGNETRPDGTVRHDGEWKNDRPVREKK